MIKPDYFIYTFMLKIGPLRVFHIFVLGNHTFGKFTPTCYVKNGEYPYCTRTLLTTLLKTTVGSMLVLYDSTMHLAIPEPYLMHVATL